MVPEQLCLLPFNLQLQLEHARVPQFRRLKGLASGTGSRGVYKIMRVVIGAMVLAAGLGLVGAASGAAAPVGVRDVGSPERGVEQVQYWRGGYCERLRRACTYKEERGETGYGNCRRYREECGGRASYCERNHSLKGNHRARSHP